MYCFSASGALEAPTDVDAQQNCEKVGAQESREVKFGEEGGGDVRCRVHSRPTLQGRGV